MISEWVTKFWDFIDNRSMVRRFVLLLTVYMSWLSFIWAMEFAAVTPKTGVEVGLLIAAVTGPISVLQAFVLKVYSDGRNL